ncbi:recombinase family protein [Streptomyces sp. NPDC056149]|uniref:recombinase family protein n=1 Tax=Streptomyces sp. NPDC056149 TaxID=3345728 RepID=UPI0035E2BF23
MANRTTLKRGATDVAARSIAGRTLRAVDYLRVSTEEQRKGYGVASQGRKTTKYIAGKEWEHVATYVDDGVSGSLAAEDRPRLNQLMADAHEGAFDVVVVKEGRAIGRNGRAFWRWVWALEDIGIFVAIAEDDIDNTTASGRKEMRRQADYAETEWETIRERTQGGLQEKAEESNSPHLGGRPPYGYRIEDQGKVGLSRLVIDPAESSVIRRVHDLVVQDGLNLRQVAIRLNAESVTTRSGRAWSRENLRDRIMSRAVLDAVVLFRGHHAVTDTEGDPVWGDRVAIPLPRILSEAEAAALRRGVASTAKKSSGNRAFYPVSGHVIGLCGAPYTGHSRESTEPGGRFYRCSGKNDKDLSAKVCDCSYIDAPALESAVWAKIVKALGDSAKLEELAAEWVGMADGDVSAHEQRITDLDQQISRLDASITAVIVATAKDTAGQNNAPEAIQAATAALQTERAQLQAMRDDAAEWLAEKEAAGNRARELAEIAKMAREELAAVDVHRQADYISLLKVKVLITGPVPVRKGGVPCPVQRWYRSAGRATVPSADLSDADWERIAPLLPKGRQDTVRRSVNAIFWKARTGESWKALPSEIARPHSAASHFLAWSKDGTWAQVSEALSGTAQCPLPADELLPPMRVEVVLDPRLMLLPEELSRTGW